MTRIGRILGTVAAALSAVAGTVQASGHCAPVCLDHGASPVVAAVQAAMVGVILAAVVWIRRL